MKLSAAQVEYLITTESQRSLMNKQYGGSIVAVHFDTVTTQHFNGQRKILPIPYIDRKSRLRVFTDSPDTARSLNALGIRPTFSIASLNVELPLSTPQDKEQIESITEARLWTKDKAVLETAAQFAPARETRRLKLKLRLEFQDGKEREGRSLPASALEKLVVDVLGGDLFGIEMVDLPRNDRGRIDYDGQHPSYIYVTDISAEAGGATNMHAIILARLKEGSALRDTEVIKSIRIKGDSTTELLRTMSLQQDPEVLSLAQVIRLLEQFFLTGGRAFLFSTCTDGSELVWPAIGRPTTDAVTSPRSDRRGRIARWCPPRRFAWDSGRRPARHYPRGCAQIDR